MDNSCVKDILWSETRQSHKMSTYYTCIDEEDNEIIMPYQVKGRNNMVEDRSNNNNLQVQHHTSRTIQQLLMISNITYFTQTMSKFPPTNNIVNELLFDVRSQKRTPQHVPLDPNPHASLFTWGLPNYGP